MSGSITHTLKLFSCLLLLPAFVSAQVGPDDSGVNTPGLEIMAGDTIRGTVDLCTDEPEEFDAVDYFFTALPDDGTVTVIGTFTYTGEETENVSPIASFSLSGSPGGGGIGGGVLTTGTMSDTAVLVCSAIDTAYLSVTTNGCFSYALTYFVTPPPTAADPAGNDDFATATPLAAGELREGRIGFRPISTSPLGIDNQDYYVTVPPDDGTLRIYVDLFKSDETDVLSLLTRVYGGDQISRGQKRTEVTDGREMVSDTFTLHCLAQDSIYILVEAAFCYGYRLRYELEPAGTARDSTGNDDAAAATAVAADSSFGGRIGYERRRLTDRLDYYSVVLPDSGRLAFAFEYENTGGTIEPGPVVNAATIAGTFLGSTNPPMLEPGESAADTLVLVGTAGDTVVVRLQAISCFAYSGIFVSPEVMTSTRPRERLSGVSVYPNPVVNGRINLESQRTLGQVDVVLRNVLGGTAYRRTLVVEAGVAAAVETAGLPPGIYVIQVLTDDARSWSRKVAITR